MNEINIKAIADIAHDLNLEIVDIWCNNKGLSVTLNSNTKISKVNEFSEQTGITFEIDGGTSCTNAEINGWIPFKTKKKKLPKNIWLYGLILLGLIEILLLLF